MGLILFCSKVGCEMIVSFRFDVVGRTMLINVTMVNYDKVYDGGGGFAVNDRFFLIFKLFKRCLRP